MVTLSACSSSKEEKETETANNDVKEEEVVEEEEEEVEEVEEEVVVDDLADFDIGEVDNFTYKNKFFGIELPLDENWYIASDNELAQISSSVADVINNDVAKESIEDGKVIFIFYTENLNDGNSINIVAQKMPLENLTASQIIDLQLDALKEEFVAMGLKNISVEKTTVNFCGEQVPAVATYAESEEGVTMDQRQVFLLNKSICAVITLGTFNGDTTQELLNLFKKY